MTEGREPTFWLGAAFLVATAGSLMWAIPAASKRVRSSASYCTACHATADVPEVRGHETVACQECHAQPESGGWRMLWGLAHAGSLMPAHGAVDRVSCEGCHAKNEDTWRTLMRTDGHSIHAAEPESMDCVQCHAASLHGNTSPSEACKSCHELTPDQSMGATEGTCITCHDFAERDAAGAETRSWLDAVSTGSLAGSVGVHTAVFRRIEESPHAPLDSNAERRVVCIQCHRGSLVASVRHAPEAHQQCLTCHDVHANRERLAVRCTSCHAQPKISVRDDRVVVEVGWTLAAEPISAELQATLTHQGRCPTCHKPHAFRANHNECRECHQDKAASMAALPPEAHRFCVGCHEPHSPVPTSAICENCHADHVSAAPTGGVPVKHRDCLSCHNPHQPKPTTQVACSAECHARPRAGVSSGPTRHQDCATCHTPHGPPKARTLVKCPTCHAEQVSSVSRTLAQTGHRQCQRCHVPHEFDRAKAMNHCDDCHEQPARPDAAHSGQPCTNCHGIHGQSPENVSQCTASCHENVRPTVSRHQRCQNCHPPHMPRTAALQRCRQCHGRQVAATPGWPQESPHSGRCNDCHTRHDEQTKKACPECHQDESTRDHTGVHPQCTGCHRPHLAGPAAPGATGRWWTRCGTCHEENARRARTAIAEHQLCQNCHNNPGRFSPPCVTCHAQIRQTALHAQPEHGECRNCHESHGSAAPTRGKCEHCHDDRRAHFADAPRCQSCHPFASDAQLEHILPSA